MTEEERCGENGAPESCQPEESVAKLKQTLEDARAKISEQEDQYLRLQAEFQNFRRRMMRENARQKHEGALQVVERILPIIDDLERVLEAGRQDDPLCKGVKMIVQSFLDALEDLGVRRIECDGEEFDPHYHEAVTFVSTDEVPKGCVVNQLQTGYRTEDRLIRPARVTVAQPVDADKQEADKQEDEGIKEE